MDAGTTDRVRIGRWLAAWAAVVFVLVLVGGGTRLTESGLSITEWKPVSGVIPPIGAAAWNVEFEKYKQIPQYSQMNAGMTLGQFQAIYWWEFVHRLLARLGGLVFALPFFWFLARRQIPRDLMPRLVLIGTLLVAQAALGWYMVASGLVGRVNVSQYRLAAHLSLALVLYVISVWTADALLNGKATSTIDGTTDDRHESPVRRPPGLVRLMILASVTVISGAFVAGLRAGKIYNEFPMMGGRWIPAEYGQLVPPWKNIFENPAAVQFNHRFLAMATALAVVIYWLRFRAAVWPALRMRLNLMLAAVLAQFAIGLTVLLLAVPVLVGVAHQAGALLLLTALTLAVRESRLAPAAG